MKLKKILSSALVVIMMFGFVVGFIPMKAEAAYIPTGDKNSTLSAEKIDALITASTLYDFESAQAMMKAEEDYLVGITTADTNYSLFINKYTGIAYYVNNHTGQILTSNPYDIGYKNGESIGIANNDYRKLVMSQISVKLSDLSTNMEYIYNSTAHAAAYYQISVEYINGGLRVNYTLGDTSTRFLLPGRIGYEKFEQMITYPMVERIVTLLQENCDPAYFAYGMEFFNNPNYVTHITGKYTTVNTGGTKSDPGLRKYLTDVKTAISAMKKDKVLDNDTYSVIYTLVDDMTKFCKYFTLKNLEKYADDPEGTAYQSMLKDFYTKTAETGDLEIYKTLEPMYVIDQTATDPVSIAKWSSLFVKYAGEYTYSDMYADEKYYGYVDKTEKKPVVRCALEYTFNADGSLSVRLPANSITFDETKYTLEYIIPLQYFGAGDMNETGYMFYPDGSGTIVDFKDFYNDSAKTSLYVENSVYGRDYCYSKITGKHQEQITLPVYGVVAETDTNEATKTLVPGIGDKVTNGYFAIIEEGASLASLVYTSGGSSSKYAWSYCQYEPFPSDDYDLSETLSVGSATSYTIVSDSKYTGSYITRYVMLTDDEIGAKRYPEGYYASSYIGMANYYRDYLTSTGVIKAQTGLSDDLPLYIEALGSMEIVKKILSFPVTTKLELTTFNDVLIMYNELIKGKDVFVSEADSMKALADAATDEAVKAEYLALEAKYRELAAGIDGLSEINFRLTGFGNGGMYYTYPTKVRWDRACGGKSGFKNLVAEAEKLKTTGKNLGIYPEYDFMYINNTEAFDGITIKGNVSRMVDNRYASKQIYNAVLQDYESFFTLVINPASLENLYAKFAKQYSKYNLKSISVSTLGSDLNSNFDEDESVNRDAAEAYVTSILSKMDESGYSVMTDKGNAYSLKHVDHILNIATDSSHYRYASYPVPFVGMILHGSISYAGTPINYSGTPAYDILRSIESGASLYYILCYQNSSHMKDDEMLNEYYGVDYKTWYDNIISTYAELNAAIGDLRDYKIVNHEIVIGERIIDDDEMEADRRTLMAEMLEELDKYAYDMIAEGYNNLKADSSAYGRDLKVVFDKAKLMAQFAEILHVEVADIAGTDFDNSVSAIIEKYQAEYASDDADAYVVSIDELVYESKYSFLTNSLARDGKDYVYTNYTSDVNNIVIVTYSNGTDTRQFILNYNIYSVNVTLADGESYEIGKYGYAVVGQEG